MAVAVPASPRRSRTRTLVARVPRLTVFPLLGALLVLALLLNAGIGAIRIGPLQVIAIVLDHLGLALPVAYTQQEDAVIWLIRVPRILLVAGVGASLAIAGAALQGIFRNPLADPALIGVSSGAALGVVAAVLLGVGALGAYSLPLAAFVGGLLATLLVYRLARQGGRVEVTTLLLTGIAVNALAGAGIGIGTFLATDIQLRTIVFWSLGSAGGATWPLLTAVLPLLVIGSLLLLRFGRALNLLVLGEREARHLGLDTERTRLIVIGLTALITGAAVSAAGIVGFIGLVTPHIIRLVAGPDHRTLLPASALGGAILLLFADLVARTAVVPRELPLGVVTALAGAPFFLWLVQRTRAAQGGWG